MTGCGCGVVRWCRGWFRVSRRRRWPAQAGRLLAQCAADDRMCGVVDVGWSLVATRSVFEHRAVVVGGDREALVAGLAGLAVG